MGRVDALVVTGGPDVDSALYGSEPHDLNDRPGTRQHAPAGKGYVRHRVELTVNSRLAAITSASGLEVDSQHHQGADRIGDGLVATAWADDGVIEALEDPDRNFLVGVQWHPEAGDDLALFKALIDAASCVNTQRSRS